MGPALSVASLKCSVFSKRMEYNSVFNYVIWYDINYVDYVSERINLSWSVFSMIFFLASNAEEESCAFSIFLSYRLLLIDTRVTWNLPPIPAIGKSHCTTSSEWNSMKSNTADNHDLQSCWDEEIQSLISITFYYGLFLVWSCFSDALQYICLLNTDFRISKLVLCFMSSWRNLSDKQNTLLPTLSTHMFL